MDSDYSLNLKDTDTSELIKSFNYSAGSIILGRGGKTDVQCASLSSGSFRCEGLSGTLASPMRGTKVMSKDHARLHWEENATGVYAFLTDLSSTNGTVVESLGETNKLTPHIPYRLKNDDVITFGRQMSDTDNAPSYLPMSFSVTIVKRPSSDQPTEDMRRASKAANALLAAASPKSVAPSRDDTFTDAGPTSLGNFMANNMSRSATLVSRIARDISAAEDDFFESTPRGYGLSEADLLRSDYSNSVQDDGEEEENEGEHDADNDIEVEEEEEEEEEVIEEEEQSEAESCGLRSPSPEELEEEEEEENDMADQDSRQSSPVALSRPESEVGDEEVDLPSENEEGDSNVDEAEEEEEMMEASRLPSPISPEREASLELPVQGSQPAPAASPFRPLSRLPMIMNLRQSLLDKEKIKSGLTFGTIEDDNESQHSHLPSPSSSPPSSAPVELEDVEEPGTYVDAPGSKSSEAPSNLETLSGYDLLDDFLDQVDTFNGGSDLIEYDEAALMEVDEVPVVAKVQSHQIAVEEEEIKIESDSSDTSISRKRVFHEDDEDAAPTTAPPSVIAQREIAPLPKRRGLHYGSAAIGFVAGIVATVVGLSSIDA